MNNSILQSVTQCVFNFDDLDNLQDESPSRDLKLVMRSAPLDKVLSFYHEDGEFIKHKISSLVESPDDAKKIVEYLASLDWERVYQMKRENAEFFAKEREEEIANGGGFCDECRDFYRRVYFGSFHEKELPSIGQEGNYCYKCYNKLQFYYLDYGSQEIRWRCEECINLFHREQLFNLPELVVLKDRHKYGEYSRYSDRFLIF